MTTRWSPPLYALSFETTDGDLVAWEVGKFDGDDELDGRVVVYLDQNKWRDMTDVQTSAGLMSKPAERQAALELQELVLDRRVILPLSSGHHTETTKWGDDARRYQLGLTTSRLSRGWQMRDPLQLRRDELAGALLASIRACPLTPPLPPFTLAPDTTSRNQTPIRVPADFPPEHAHQFRALTHATAIVSVLLDADQVPPSTKQNGWVPTNQAFSDWLDSERTRTGAQKRRSVDALLFSDISLEIAEEAHRLRLRPEQMSQWNLGSMFDDMAAMPSLGIYRALLQERHLNVGTTWRLNDLTDMIYLSAGAGYADVVVAERHMTAMLTQAQRKLGRAATVFSSVGAAMPHIRKAVDESRGLTEVRPLPM